MTPPARAGLYRLQETTANPDPDRRRKDGFWALREWPAGTRLAVQELPADEDSPAMFLVRAIDYPERVALLAESPRGRAALAASLPHAPGTLDEVLTVTRDRSPHVYPHDVLAHLLDSGRVTLADVSAACDALARAATAGESP